MPGVPAINTFSEQSMTRIAAAVRKLEHQVAELNRWYVQSHVQSGGKSFIAKSGAAIPGMTSSTPSSADVTIYRVGTDGVLETTGIVVKAYNIATAEVASDTWIQIKQEHASGRWVVDFEDCPDA